MEDKLNQVTEKNIDEQATANFNQSEKQISDEYVPSPYAHNTFSSDDLPLISLQEKNIGGFAANESPTLSDCFATRTNISKNIVSIKSNIIEIPNKEQISMSGKKQIDVFMQTKQTYEGPISSSMEVIIDSISINGRTPTNYIPIQEPLNISAIGQNTDEATNIDRKLIAESVADPDDADGFSSSDYLPLLSFVDKKTDTSAIVNQSPIVIAECTSSTSSNGEQIVVYKENLLNNTLTHTIKGN